MTGKRLLYRINEAILNVLAVAYVLGLAGLVAGMIGYVIWVHMRPT